MHTHLITIRVPSDGRKQRCLVESDGPAPRADIARIVERLQQQFPGTEVTTDDLGDVPFYTVDEMLQERVLGSF